MIAASSSNVAPSAVPLPAVVSSSRRTLPGTRESASTMASAFLASDGDDLWVAAGPRFARIDRHGTTLDEIGAPDGTTAITCALGGPSGRTLFMAVAVVDMEEFVAGRASSEIRMVELPPRS